jgi:tetratricopeptide (TPR) repeat protein
MKRTTLLLLCAGLITLYAGCASRNYTYYLVEPEPQRNPALSEDESLQRPFQYGSNTSMKVRWTDENLMTEIDVPMLSSGQRVVIEHAAEQTGVKPLPTTQLVPPPPTAADAPLVDAYTSRGLRVNDDAVQVSIHRANEQMREAIKNGNYALGLEWAELVLARYPSHPRFLRAKASLLLLMGERQKAIEIYEKAESIESDPGVRKKLDELQSSEP